MKITKAKLRQVIKEELTEEELGPMLYDLFKDGRGAQAEEFAKAYGMTFVWFRF